jgi:hypothetical protein
MTRLTPRVPITEAKEKTIPEEARPRGPRRVTGELVSDQWRLRVNQLVRKVDDEDVVVGVGMPQPKREPSPLRREWGGNAIHFLHPNRCISGLNGVPNGGKNTIALHVAGEAQNDENQLFGHLIHRDASINPGVKSVLGTEGTAKAMTIQVADHTSHEDEDDHRPGKECIGNPKLSRPRRSRLKCGHPNHQEDEEHRRPREVKMRSNPGVKE